MRYLIKICAIFALFWVSVSVFASCAPESLLMGLLPCGAMTHESMICPMTVLSSATDVAEAVLVFKDSAVLIILAIVAVSILARPLFQKFLVFVQIFRWRDFRAPIFFANWLQFAFRTGLLNSKIF